MEDQAVNWRIRQSTGGSNSQLEDQAARIGGSSSQLEDQTVSWRIKQSAGGSNSQLEDQTV
jgi:hypothetical protein